ncbi:iron ABC transporter permease [uncultured Fusobacterium sp.]|uniref:ABC transporter permease n=1 Tax=uncultured Fusobacterium sp. TaxID=159267 RepID=UPI0025E4293D|nr:iron ABC transporter permease [uncultured Fusobacterium sp.]
MSGNQDLEIKQNNFSYNLILFLVIIGVVLFCFYPIYKIIVTSFFDNNSFTLKFYKGIFNENYLLLKNSMITSSISAGIASIFGGIIAYYMLFSSERVRKFYYYLLMLTMISPPFIFGISYIMLFGRRGLITYRVLGLHTNPYGLKGIVMLQLIGEISFATFMLYEIFKNFDYTLINASRALGASPWESLKRVVFPISVPAFLGTFFILFTKNLSDFGSAIIIGGRESTLATEAYLTVIGEGNMPKAAAMTLLLIFPALLAFLLYKRILLKKFSSFSVGKGMESKNISYSLPFGVKILFKVVAYLFVLIMFIQYSAIFFSGFYNYTSKGIEFTLEYIEKFKLSSTRVFLRTIVYAFISGAISSTIGILISYYNRERNSYFFKGIEFLGGLPYIIPGTFFGLGYILAFNSGIFTLTGTATIVILNCAFRQISIGIKAGDSIFSTLNPNIEKAGRDLGASKMRILLDIIFPLLKPAFLISFVNCFIATMTTIGAIIFLVSPGNNVATIMLFTQVAQGEYGAASITALAITFITFSLNIFVAKVLKK